MEPIVNNSQNCKKFAKWLRKKDKKQDSVYDNYPIHFQEIYT